VTHDELLAEIESAIEETRDDLRRLTLAWTALGGATGDRETVGRMIYLDRSRRVSDLADEASA
jgi:hypothetical protein